MLAEVPRREEGGDASTSSSVHHLSSWTNSAFSRSHPICGSGVKVWVRTRWNWSAWPSHSPFSIGITWSRLHTCGPISALTRPSSSASSRRSASTGSSSGSMPPPGRAHTTAVGKSNRTSSTRSAGSSSTAHRPTDAQLRAGSWVHAAVRLRVRSVSVVRRVAEAVVEAAVHLVDLLALLAHRQLLGIA